MSYFGEKILFLLSMCFISSSLLVNIVKIFKYRDNTSTISAIMSGIALIYIANK
jgi:hypothetical protein